jgi:hydrogenase expression/formation protein HypE
MASEPQPDGSEGEGRTGACPLPLSSHDEVTLGHGSGGILTARLIREVILPAFDNALLAPLDDGVVFEPGGGRLAFSTDSFVVSPLFFPGGDIGSLAVYGTVNDLAMCGARPRYLSASFIIEEGLPVDELRRVVESMRRAAGQAGVHVVTGDTKVVDRRKADRLFINTAGIGVVRPDVHLASTRIREGDHVLVSGPIAVHGIAILSVREGLEFDPPIASDSNALHHLVETMLDACTDIRALRDPTRGGLSSALNEMAQSARLGIRLDEASIPIGEDVRGACEILGLDPLHIANEGKLLAIVPAEATSAVLASMHRHPEGLRAARIGTVVSEHPGMVTMKTRVGGSRVVEQLSGEQLPRIC